MDKLIKKLEFIRDNPPDMYNWKTYDAWYTSANYCIQELRMFPNLGNHEKEKT